MSDKEKTVEKEPTEICMLIDNKRMIVFDKDGISLNRDNFPDFEPDDFVREFIRILEEGYAVKFIKKPK